MNIQFVQFLVFDFNLVSDFTVGAAYSNLEIFFDSARRIGCGQAINARKRDVITEHFMRTKRGLI